MHIRLKRTLLPAAALLLLFAASCAGPENAEDRFAEIIDSRVANFGVSRADPGYMQYLERQSMHAEASRLAQMISGSNFIWRRPAETPRPEDLLKHGSVWLAVSPQTLQTPGRSTPLAHLSGPTLWSSLEQCGIHGLYIAPTGTSGNLWDHDRKRSLGVHDDIIQYSFPKSIGAEQDYARIIERAKAHNILLGGDLVPAATGIGPDFLLAVRNLRDYPGIYCLIEAPKELWSILPPSVRNDGEIEIFPLDDDQVYLLSGVGLFPQNLRQDALAPYIESGWAATGEVRCSDGNLRRWVYRYAGGIKRPVLNFGDPSGAARKIMSGSTVFQSAILGNALNAASLYPLLGLEPESDTAGGDDPSYFSLLTGVAGDIARQSRAYGSKSWLKDELPLAAVRAAMSAGPDVFQDNVFSPAAEHALLSGDASLLNFMADEALYFGLDLHRLVHGSIAQEGLSYALPHLRRLADQDQMHSARASRAGELLAEVYTQAQNIAAQKSTEGPVSLFENGRLYTTPVGLAALALGLRDNTKLTPELEMEIRRGHMLLQFFKAMQPGVFMLSGQDIAGVLPIDVNALSGGRTGDERLNDKRLLPRGGFPLLGSAETGVFNTLAPARTKSLYGSLDVQLYQTSSFARELGDLLALRQRLGIAGGTLAGRLNPEGRGVSALVTSLPGSGQNSSIYLVSLVNFSRETRHEFLNLADIPELAEILGGAGVEQLAGNLAYVHMQDNRLAVTAPGWSAGLVLIAERPSNRPDEPQE